MTLIYSVFAPAKDQLVTLYLTNQL